MEEQKQTNSSDFLPTAESSAQKHSSDDLDTQPVASKSLGKRRAQTHNSPSTSVAPPSVMEEDKVDRKKASARAAQARYAAKIKAKKERDIDRLKQVSEQVDQLESSKKKMEGERSALTAQLESKKEMLSILHRAQTSITQQFEEQGPCPSIITQQLSPSTSRQEISLTTTTTTTTTTAIDKPIINTHVDNSDNTGQVIVIPSQADATIDADYTIEAMINTKVEEIKERHGFFPNNIAMTEAIKKMGPSEYVAHWGVLLIEITGLVNMLDSIGDGDGDDDDDGDKEKYARTESQIHGCLIKHIPVFYVAVKYNPSVFVELIMSSKSIVKSGESKEECRLRIIKFMGLTAEQIARAKGCVERFEDAASHAHCQQNDILKSLKVVEDPPPAITAGGGRDTNNNTIDMVDCSNDNEVGNLLGIGSMQQMMEQYLNLTELTGKLELWEKKHLVGVLGLVTTMDAIFQPMQRARVLTLTAPAFPNLLELMHCIAGKFD